MNIKPLGTYVLIKPIEDEIKTTSGIIIPDTASKEKPQTGEVIDLGSMEDSDGKKISTEVKAGDIVVYRKWGGTEIKSSSGEVLLLVKIDELLAIVE